MKKCIYCNTELVKAELTENHEYSFELKKLKSFPLDFFRSSSSVTPYVCSNCGFIALFADSPEIFGSDEY